MAPRRCPTCGSKQWHKEPSSGLIACSEGHVLQNYRNEATELGEDMGQRALRKRTLKSGRKKREGVSKANPELYHGARGRFLYFECQQLLLRKQVAALTKSWSLPPEFEIICRDIWAIHLMLLPNPPSENSFGNDHHDQGVTRVNEGGENNNVDVNKNVVTSDSRSSRSPVRPEREYVDSDKDEESEDDRRGDGEEDGEENDPELAALLQMNSDMSSSESEGEPKQDQCEGKTKAKDRRQRGRYAYEMPASTIAVLIVACWMLRIPVMCRDFVRLIEMYELPYLDPVSRKLLPANMVVHLTKHNIQALSPYHAPSTMTLHSLASRLSKKMYSTYGIFTPEANSAPILWRIVSHGLGSTPTLYKLTKRLSHVLSLPLTLHHTLAPGLERLKAHDPIKHNYDNVPPEVSFVSVAIVVLKMVYGLDGRQRLPNEPSDPACALPRIEEYLRHVMQLNETDSKSKSELFNARSTMCAADLKDKMMDGYLDFCQRALLPEADGDGEDNLLARYFTLSNCSAEGLEGEADIRLGLEPTLVGSEGLRPGEGHRMYNARDTFGTLPRDYELVVSRGAGWVGVSVEFVNGMIETYERRLVRWWELERRRVRDEE